MINRLLALNLMGYLTALPIVDRLSGMVKTIEKKDWADKGKRPTFPASHDVFTEAEIKPTEYLDMSPNSKYKSVIFFEDWGCRIVGQRGALREYSSTLRLVCWINQQRVDLDELSIVHQLLDALPTGFTNAEGITKINVLPTRILGQEERIFSRYAFDETTRQYLMLPYISCALELTVTFSVNPSCLNL
jgi:hypothetical protein